MKNLRIFEPRTLNVPLANIFHRYLFPSLRRLEVSFCTFSSDDDIANFIYPLLIGRSNTEDSIVGDSKNIQSNVDQLLLQNNLNSSLNTMSVVAQWLRGSTPDYGNIDVAAADGASTSTVAVDKFEEDAIRSNQNLFPKRRLLSLRQYRGRNRPDDDGMHLGNQFCSALSQSKLYELDFSFHKISATTFTNFINALCCNESQSYLRRINFSNCNMSKHTGVMCKYLSTLGNINNSLKYLNVSNCQLNDNCLITTSNQLHHGHHHGHHHRGHYHHDDMDVDRRGSRSNDVAHGHCKLHTLILGSGHNFTDQCIAERFVPAAERTCNHHLELIVLEQRNFASRRKLRFVCDINRGGRKYLFCDNSNDDYDGGNDTVPDNDDNNNNNNDNVKNNRRRRSKGKKYPSSLWSLIFHRITSPTSKIFEYVDTSSGMDFPSSRRRDMTDFDRTNNKKGFIETVDVRRASVIYYLLLNGAMVDCLSA